MNRYRHTFKSGNDEDQEFTLEFESRPDRTSKHRLASVQVYQHRTDAYCSIKQHTSTVRTNIQVSTILGTGFNFSIDVYVTPTGPEIFIIESILTTISHKMDLQPCNINDQA